MLHIWCISDFQANCGWWEMAQTETNKEEPSQRHTSNADIEIGKNMKRIESTI